MPGRESGESTPSNVTAARPIQKRKRDHESSRDSASKAIRNGQSNVFARRRTPPRDPPPIRDDDGRDRSASRSPPRQLKRPGAGARVARERKEAADAVRREREAQDRAAVSGRQTSAVELVAEHYNAVPERGREWRKTDSQIKGLRSLNNWIKSTLIQKFSRPEVIPPNGLCVLDMACGKGGDLGKWEKAPIMPALYVGCDIADVSIEQAKQRYGETLRKNNGRHRRAVMQAEFYVQDTFARPLLDIATIRQVGFNPNAGPGPAIIQGGMMSGGFDVVSMMFALHYSFENEALARGMLKNVAGALKKGGRFIGVMPSSDVITATVKKILQAEQPGKTPNGRSSHRADEDKEEGEAEDDWNPEQPSGAPEMTVNDDAWDPEKPSEPQGPSEDAEDDGDWDPEKPSEPADATVLPAENGQPAPADGSKPQATPPSVTPNSHPVDPNAPPLEFGNSIYTVRFPRQQPLVQKPLPTDGVFRPPFGWKYHYSLAEAVNAPEYVVPWEAFRALAEDYGLELMYRKGFREVFEDESTDRELGILAERMGVMSRDRSMGRNGLMVSDEEMEAASFYHAFCFYKI